MHQLSQPGDVPTRVGSLDGVGEVAQKIVRVVAVCSLDPVGAGADDATSPRTGSDTSSRRRIFPSVNRQSAAPDCRPTAQACRCRIWPPTPPAVRSPGSAPSQPGTVHLTMAQALVRFVSVQYSEHDGQIQRLIAGVSDIYARGKVAGLGQALEEPAGDRADRTRGSAAFLRTPTIEE